MKSNTMGLVSTTPSKETRFEEAENKLSVSLGSLSGYISVSETAIIPSISINNACMTLPLFLSKFVSIQDLFMEYSNVTVQLVSQHASKPSSHTSHHHSSSSLSFTNSIIGTSLFSQDYSSKQSLLQKSASKVRQIAKSVKNTTPSKPAVASTEPPKRTLLFSLNVTSTTLRIQITSSSFVSYIIHSLQLEYSQKAILLHIQKHELEVSKSTLSFTDRILTSPSLPEISLLFRFPANAPPVSEIRSDMASLHSEPSIPGGKGLSQDSSTAQSLSKKTGFGSTGGNVVPVSEKPSRVVVEVGFLKLDFTSKQVNSFIEIAVLCFCMESFCRQKQPNHLRPFRQQSITNGGSPS